MTRQTHCQYCGANLDIAQEFLFWVEATAFEDRVSAPIEHVQQLSQYYGEPIRLCKECRSSIEKNQRDLVEERDLNRDSPLLVRRVLPAIGLLFLFCLLAILASALR